MRENRFRLLEVHKHTLVVYISVIVIPFIIAVSIITWKTSNEIKTSKIENIKQLNEQLNNNIDLIMADINRYSYLNTLFYNIEPILRKNINEKESSYVDDLNTLSDIVRYATTLNPYVVGMSIVGKNGMIYSNTRQTQQSYEQLYEFIDRARSSSDNKYISSIYESNVYGQSNKKTITLTRLILDTGFYKEIGAICLDIDYQSIKKEFVAASGDNADINLIVSQSNNIIYQSALENSLNFLRIDDRRELLYLINNSENKNLIPFKKDGKKYLLFSSVNVDTGWNIIRCLPLYLITNNIYSTIKFFVFVLFIILIFTILTGYYLSIRMSKPINELNKAMKQIEENGNITTIDKYTERRDEIGQLIGSFNRMSTKLKDSIQKEYIARIHSRQSEIKMLQAQINPHFLYNTLNLIGSIAEVNDVDEITRASVSLSKMFRYSIKGKNIVTIRQELEQVDNYIKIQQLRFPNKIDIVYSLNEDVFNYRILKFLIQPLVENSIYHGIEKKQGHGFVKLKVDKQYNLLTIFVEDDGIGMSERKIRLLNEQLSKDNGISEVDEGNASMGIKNVHYRIQSYYGKDYGLSVFTNSMNGITVKLVIPVVAEGDV